MAGGPVQVIQALFYVLFCNLRSVWQFFVPPPKKDIKGQIALVTGGGHGIGRELAKTLAQEGATVVIWDINEKNNQETVQIVEKEGGKIFAYTCDVTSSDNVREVSSRVRQEVGEVDILLNNAGVCNYGWIMDLQEKDIRRTFDVNHISHYYMIHEFLPSMIKRGRGHIVGTVSGIAFVSHVLLSDYSASKAAGHKLYNTLRMELALKGIDCIAITEIFPAVVDTGFIPEHDVPKSEQLTPSRVARAAVDGILRNQLQVCIPGHLQFFAKFLRFLPIEAHNYLMNGILKQPFHASYKHSKKN